jgi:hypothetical protein
MYPDVVSLFFSRLSLGEDNEKDECGEKIFVCHEIPSYLAGRGMTDIIVSIGSWESNFARINLGEAMALK